MTVTYSAMLDLAGNVRVEAARASDGTIVATGQAMLGGDVIEVAVQGDAGPTAAYKAWLASGNTPGAPVAPVRTCAGPTLVKAATDDAWVKVKARDQACIAGRDSLPETLDMIARAAKAMETTPKVWFDLALGVTT